MPEPRDVRFSMGCLHWLAAFMAVILISISFLVGLFYGVPYGLPFLGFPLLVLGMMIYTKIKKSTLQFHSIRLGPREEILHVEKNLKMGIITPTNVSDRYLNNAVFTNHRLFVLSVNTIIEVYDFCSSGEDELRLVMLTRCLDPHDVQVEPTCVVLKPPPPESGVEIRIHARDLQKVIEILELWRRHSKTDA